MIDYVKLSFAMSALVMVWITFMVHMSEKIGTDSGLPQFNVLKHQIAMYLMCVIVWPIIAIMAIFMMFSIIIGTLKK